LEQGRAVGNKELREYLEIEGYADAANWVYAQAIRRTWDDPSNPTPPRINLTELREIHRRTVAPAWSLFPPDPILPGEGAQLALLESGGGDVEGQAREVG